MECKTLKKIEETDVAVIGAGIIGCAIARELSKLKIKITVLEKMPDVGWGTTKANSGVIHPGYSGEEDTLKFKLCHKGNLLFQKNAEELGIPIRKVGSFLNAVDPSEINLFEAYMNRGIRNGLTDLEIIVGNEKLRKYEPNLSKSVCAALFSKETFITTPYLAAVALFENAKTNKVDFIFKAEVKNIFYHDLEKKFFIETDKFLLKADYVINAAGIQSEKIANMVKDYSFKITPVKGQYLLFDSIVGKTVNLVNFKVKINMESTKGVLIAPTISRNFFIGPTYEETEENDFDSTPYGIKLLKSKAEEIFTRLPYKKIITSFTGLRSVADSKDFIIDSSSSYRKFINVAGIQSPGLTCVFSISEIVGNIIKNINPVKIRKNNKFIPERKSSPGSNFLDLDYSNELYKKNKNYAEVICRCEKITEAEIIQAIHNGADTIDGIKFRTRAGMGRCQSGYCLLKVMDILARELNIPFEEVTKSGKGSYIVKGKVI